MSDELERFDPETCNGRIAYEHLHRYTICAQFVDGKSVLDLACGTGYGTEVLASRATRVTGLDIDTDSIARAKKEKRLANISFVVGDAYDLPFDDGEFDMVVANEMIEHVGDHDVLLKEIKRVLGDRGRLLVSTPNKSVYNRHKAPNRFHISEMERQEFADLLEEHFGHVKMIGQRMALLSAAFGLERGSLLPNQHSAETLSGRRSAGGFEIKAAPLALRDPEYLVAICSDAPLDEVELPASIFFMPGDDLWLEHEKVFAWASKLHEEDEELRANLLSLSQREAESRASLDAAIAEAARLRDAAAGFEQQAGQAARDRDDLTRRAIAAQTQVDDNIRTLRRLLEATGVAVEGHDQTSLIAGLFALQRKLVTLEASIGDHERMREALQLAERNRADAQKALLEAERRAKAAEDRAGEATSRSEMDHAAAERMRADLNAAQLQVGALRERAKSAEERSAMFAQVRRKLSTTPSWRSSRPSFLDRLRAAPPLFDPGYIAARNPGIDRVTWTDYCRKSDLFTLDPHPLFSAAHYLAENPDVAVAGLNPLAHYLEHGWRQGRSPSPFFDNDWYLSRNPDVLAAGINPLVHYAEYGFAEGREPSPTFDAAAYLRANPDVARDGIDPFLHWVGYGQHEGRRAPIKSSPSAARSNPEFISASVAEPGKTSADLSPGTGRRSPWEAKDPQISDYWLPQTLRDVIVERHGEQWVATYQDLFATMERFKDRPEQFAQSAEGQAIVAECATLAAQAARKLGSRPDASVIIPVYNNFLDTSLCILSLLRSGSTHTFEIIVADDGSTDPTKHRISSIGGCVRYLRQPENLGFLKNCNAAAEQATGRVFVFLNNDTIVLPGWLDGLLSPFATDDVGMVGSKLLNWDGTLQEAGGIFWRDGSAWNFGRNQDSRAPEFNYLKDVDYCSGASIAVPAQIWREVGGFDPAFTPAYCEDSDLAFRLREAGYRTVYNPASELVHHEGRSHGRDVSSGIKAYQIANNERLLDRWRHVLERDHFENAQNVLRARDRSGQLLHVLVVDHYVPQWDKDAGSRTIYEFIRVLVEAGTSVTFWPDNLNYDADYTPQLQQLGVEVIHGSAFVDGFEKFIRDRADLYDMILLSRPHIAANYFDAIRHFTKATIAYYGHDVHFKRTMARRVLEGLPAEDDGVIALREQEVSVGNRSDVILYPSQEEADLMGSLVDANVRSLAVPAYRFGKQELDDARSRLQRRQDIADPIQLLFVGGFGHPPNVDAITWFVKDVLPEYDPLGREVMLHIVGSKAGREIEVLQQSNVKLHGFVSDEELSRLYRDADVVVAPLRYGAGVKGKVIEAMARGVPVVTTDAGAQGIPNSERLLFIANSPEEFARATTEACRAEESRSRAMAGLDFIERQYSTDAMAKVLLSAIPERARQAH